MKLTLETAWEKRLKLRAEAILEIKGNIKLEWKFVNNDYVRHLEPGEVFKI